jgi:hypothetical protein
MISAENVGRPCVEIIRQSQKGVWTASGGMGNMLRLRGCDYARSEQGYERAEPGCAAKVNVAVAHYLKRTRIFRIENLLRAAYNQGVGKSMHARPNRLNR